MPIKRILILFIFLCSLQLFAQPGRRYELNSISFEGNNTFSSSTLADNIFSQSTPWWFWKFLHSIWNKFGKEPVYFDSSNIQIDLTSLKDYYNSNGFFDAKIGYKYDVDTSAGKVDLTFIIDENKPSYFGKVDITGIQGKPGIIYTGAFENAKVDTTKRYSQKVVQDNANRVINNLLDDGYVFARYDSTIIIKDTSRDKADMNIFITTGNRYKVDTVLIDKSGEGAGLVEDKLLRDVTGIEQGEYLSQDELRSSQARLYRTGLFNSVLITPDYKDTTDSKIPVLLTGNIGLMNELSPEVILNNQNRAFNAGLGFSYTRKNFLGNARKLTASSSFGVQDMFRIDYSTLIKRFNFQDTTIMGYVDSRVVIDQPYLFDKPIFGTWETYATITKQADYNNTIYGSKVTFDFEMPVYTFINNLSASYTLEQSYTKFRTYNDLLSRTFISDIAGDASSTTADNILFPTQGYNLTFHIEEANSLPYLFSKVFKIDSLALFYKVVLSGSYYTSLDKNRNSIFATKFKVGNIQIFHGNFSGVPVNRSFYAGGSNSVRGWRPNDLVPVGSESVLQINGASIKGGTFLMEGSFELRRRFLENFGFAIFTDYGNTWLGYNQFRWDGVAVAAGLGFRYYTLVAPFRIDLGLKFYDPNPGNNKPPSFLWHNWDPHFFNNIVLHFGLGEAF